MTSGGSPLRNLLQELKHRIVESAFTLGGDLCLRMAEGGIATVDVIYINNRQGFKYQRRT